MLSALTTFETESVEIQCQCGFVCYGVSALKLHNVEHKIESLKEQFRYHFGQLWDMMYDPSERQIGLCSDCSLKIDYSKAWSTYPVQTQDKLILESLWGFTYNMIFHDQIKRIKRDAGIIDSSPKESSDNRLDPTGADQ